MADKDVKNLVDRVVKSGWTSTIDGRNHWRLTSPDGLQQVTIPTSPGTAFWEKRALGKLKRAGWEPEAAVLEKRKQSRARTEEERAKADAELARRDLLLMAQAATRERLQAAMGTAASPGELASYSTASRYVPLAELRAAMDLNGEHGCNRRDVYPAWVAKWSGMMRRGAWHHSPEPIIFCREHGCLVDGMHRATAACRLAEEDPELFEGLFPYGVPFTVVTDYPTDLVKILNGGKSRSPKDVLSFAGLGKNQFPVAAALRLLVAYDAREPWIQWTQLKLDNDELDAAIAGPYARLTSPEVGTTAHRLRHKTKMTPAAAWALPFLLDRDGHDPEFAEEFYAGLCLETDLFKGDPRGVLGQALLRGISSSNPLGKKAPGAYHLCIALKAYYLWGYEYEENGDDSTQSIGFKADEQAYAVWRPGMVKIGKEIRVSYRPAR